ALERTGITRGKSTHGFHLFSHSAASIVHVETRDLTLAQELLEHTRLKFTNHDAAGNQLKGSMLPSELKRCLCTIANAGGRLQSHLRSIHIREMYRKFHYQSRFSPFDRSRILMMREGLLLFLAVAVSHQK